MIKLEQGLRVHSFSFYVLLNYSNLNSKCFQKKLFQDVTKKILTGIIFHRWTKQKETETSAAISKHFDTMYLFEQ